MGSNFYVVDRSTWLDSCNILESVPRIQLLATHSGNSSFLAAGYRLDGMKVSFISLLIITRNRRLVAAVITVNIVL
jgi:hypothetical protein